MKTTIAVILLSVLSSVLVPAQSTGDRKLVDVDRAKADPEYRITLRHHAYIKMYLGAPARKRPEFTVLLKFLLEHGYGIEDLRKSWFALNKPVPEYSIERARARGLSKEDVVKEQRTLAFLNREIRRRDVMEATGIHDVAFADALIDIVPEQHKVLNDMPLAIEEQNEPLLTDDDWLTPDLQRCRSSYKGEAKRMSPKPLPADAPMNIDPIVLQ